MTSRDYLVIKVNIVHSAIIRSSGKFWNHWFNSLKRGLKTLAHCTFVKINKFNVSFWFYIYFPSNVQLKSFLFVPAMLNCGAQEVWILLQAAVIPWVVSVIALWKWMIGNCANHSKTLSVFGPDRLTIQNEPRTRSRESFSSALRKSSSPHQHFQKKHFWDSKNIASTQIKRHMLNKIPWNDTDQQQSSPTLTAGGTDGRQLRRTSCPVSFLVQAWGGGFDASSCCCGRWRRRRHGNPTEVEPFALLLFLLLRVIMRPSVAVRLARSTAAGDSR